MTRPVILLDCDGPMTDGFFIQMCGVLCDLGIDADPARINNWDVCSAFGCSDEVRAAAYAEMREPGVCASFMPHAGAREFVDRLREWATVLAVTAPLNGSPTWANEREWWLEAHLGFKPAEVISARDKVHVYGDVLVDDKTSTIRQWQHRWPASISVLWRGPHNAADVWTPAVNSYSELLKLLYRIKDSYKFSRTVV